MDIVVPCQTQEGVIWRAIEIFWKCMRSVLTANVIVRNVLFLPPDIFNSRALALKIEWLKISKGFKQQGLNFNARS